MTGHRVVFRTDDPIEHPLPSWGLLEVQWHLKRIAIMRAKKHTTAGIRWWSPTQLLTGRRVA